MTRSDRRRLQRRIDRRHQILEHAEALFAERGYDATKVTDICDRAGIAYGTFFNHFPEKRELLRALAERALQKLSESLEQLAKEPMPLDEQLRVLFRGGERGFDASRRELVGHIWKIAATEAPESQDRRFHGAFEAFLREGVSRGRVRDDVAIEVLAEVIGSTFSCMALHWVHAETYPAPERAEQFARFLAEALAPRAAAATPDVPVSPAVRPSRTAGRPRARRPGAPR